MKITSLILLLTAQFLILSTTNAFADQPVEPSDADTQNTAESQNLISSTHDSLQIDTSAIKSTHSSNEQAVDSSEIKKKEQFRQKLQDNVQEQLAHYNHGGLDFHINDQYHLSPATLFLSDGTTPSEALRFHPFITTARYNLSSSLNRYMLYGSVAPVNKVLTGNLLYEINDNSLKGTDQSTIADLSEIHFRNSAVMQYKYRPLQLSTPEALIFWENGVFDENLLAVSISRPLSKNITVNAFTTYRYFKSGTFTQSSDIYSFFKNISDTNYISENGYNPLTDEFLAGANIYWRNENNSQLQLKISYGDLNHEQTLDSVVVKREDLKHALIHRYPLQIGLSSSFIKNNFFFLGIEGQFRDEPIIKIAGKTLQDKTVPDRYDAKVREFDIALFPGFQINRKDSIGLYYYFNRSDYSLFDKNDIGTNLHHPELRFNYHFNLLNFDGLAEAGAGLNAYSLDDTSTVVAVWNIGASLKNENQHYRLYLQQDNVPFIVNFDTLLIDQLLLDSYLKAGTEVNFKWKKLNLQAGYQFVYGVDSISVAKSWPSQTVPYQQPVSSLIFAPSFGRWHGFALSTSTTLSDKRPFLKMHSALSFIAHPENTREYINAAVTFDYWSEREKITYAGFSDWNVPIYNVGIQMAAHIRSFRLFYKIDNLLNRRFAYIPGYYSPGITFRWGFNWYLQR